MVSVYDVKPAFQNLLRPICKRLAEAGVTANQVTVGAFLLSVLFGVVLLAGMGWPWLFSFMPVVLFVRMALNAIDGMLAREHDMKSKLGAYLNELTDVVSDIFLYLPFCVVPGISPDLVIGVLFLAAIVEFTGVLGYSVGSTRQYQGPMGKSDRALHFGVMSLLVGFQLCDAIYLSVYLWILVILSLLTVKNRLQAGLREEVI